MKKTILKDTREQKPFLFSDNVKTRKATLKVGDYSIVGGNGIGGIIVERKSIEDFFNSLIPAKNYKRFLKNLGKMKKFSVRLFVVEGSYTRLCQGSTRSVANGELIVERFLADCMEFGVMPIMCSTKFEAARITERFLTSFVKHNVKGLIASKLKKNTSKSEASRQRERIRNGKG